MESDYRCTPCAGKEALEVDVYEIYKLLEESVDIMDADDLKGSMWDLYTRIKCARDIAARAHRVLREKA